MQTGNYEPKASVQTIANAMDVGDPSNFARIWDLYGKDVDNIRSMVSGATVSDDVIRKTVAECWKSNGYLLDPHGACGYRALKDGLKPGETGLFCETAHPAKFKDTIESIIGTPVEIPAKLAAFMKGEKKSVSLSADYEDFKRYLTSKI
mgnify:FL=1